MFHVAKILIVYNNNYNNNKNKSTLEPAPQQQNCDSCTGVPHAVAALCPSNHNA